MTKFTKGITFYRLKIIVTDTDSFEECDKEILKRLSQHPELDQAEVKEIKRMIL